MNNAVEIERVREYLTGQEDLKLGIVFGSLASNKAGLNSDLDIAISTDQPLTVERKMARICQCIYSEALSAQIESQSCHYEEDWEELDVALALTPLYTGFCHPAQGRQAFGRRAQERLLQRRGR